MVRNYVRMRVCVHVGSDMLHGQLCGHIVWQTLCDLRGISHKFLRRLNAHSRAKRELHVDHMPSVSARVGVV